MTLKIKHKEAEQLAKELSELTGESKARAVIVALRDRIEREKRRRRVEALTHEILEIGRGCAAMGRRDHDPHGELLYDKNGLSR